MWLIPFMDRTVDTMKAEHSNECEDQFEVLTKVLRVEAERMRFSDEDMERLLVPLKKRIMSGEFSRPSRQSLLLKWTASLVVAAILSVSLTQVQASDTLFSIMDNTIPLSGDLPTDHKVFGLIVMEGIGVGGICLTLVDAVSREPVQMAISREDGSYAFTKLPPGTYRIKITLPPELALEDQAYGEWVAFNGRTDIEMDTSDNDEREGLAIRICQRRI